ncbi:gluconate 2-dehydrogenase subunit 3 family protein [Flagellimonas halotolerans]|uniref:Gluconate 2-dehydrogenase subunit 3 family protein n=1 Tax=Flagellimonas halotolerans TaxID=3112164 RepID=A0ABU6ISG3_9FLAO|nr:MULTISPECIES: gluconate 2-dehydrogenase subunit 3 family protein [unclassified Allomuricauda]MEC3966251.1 gluconate 2-dehydrogenase subunit 3 family protein [Muricauda sp. SYSU M86414]MEC4266063.1 gluconate 2-dehydrogenase subunit 3 family protein [Muricauda sp. SYSU M84420]
MDRRKSIQTMIMGAGASALAFYGCKADAEMSIPSKMDTAHFGRTPEELERIGKLNAQKLFSDHELETIAVLSSIILPSKEPYGGPIEAKVPEFIEFIAKDIPEFELTLKGGLMWLDYQSNKLFDLEFKKAALEQQKQILDTIAFHDATVPLDVQPLEIQFFAIVRNLTVTGYYTSKEGIADLGYKGNRPNIWDGVPQDILDQHGVAYDPEWIAKCVDQSKRNIIAEWDENGNLLT